MWFKKQKNKEERFGRFDIDEFKKLCDSLPPLPQLGRWTPVEQCLPHEGQKVFIKYDDGTACAGFYGKGRFTCYDSMKPAIENVVFWMPQELDEELEEIKKGLMKSSR